HEDRAEATRDPERPPPGAGREGQDRSREEDIHIHGVAVLHDAKGEATGNVAAHDAHVVIEEREHGSSGARVRLQVAREGPLHPAPLGVRVCVQAAEDSRDYAESQHERQGRRAPRSEPRSEGLYGPFRGHAVTRTLRRWRARERAPKAPSDPYRLSA